MQVLKVAVTGATTLPLESLEPFQGDLKRLEREEYEKLRKNLIENGISFTTHVWQHEGRNYIIDGHQRRFTMETMKNNEGWQIPEIPVSLVQADSFAEAKRKVLAGTSQYGKMTAKSLAEFAETNDIPYDEIVASFRFPEIDTSEFIEQFERVSEQLNAGPEIGNVPDIRHAGDDVKQVQLFFDKEKHAKFIMQVTALAEVYEKQNITDALAEIVDEVYTANFSKRN